VLLVVRDGPLVRLRRRAQVAREVSHGKAPIITRFGFDGVTIAAAPTDYALVDGWTQGTLTGPAGILPAGLFGKVPAGDPYLAHINVLSPAPLAPGDFFELQSGTPVQPRVQFVPSPDNTRLILVRPTDRLRLFVQAQARSSSSC
jgi:hypothetical protein